MAPPPRSRSADCASMYSAAALDASIHSGLFHAAAEGDLRFFKGLVQVLDNGRGRVREAVEAMSAHGGLGALHVAATCGRLELCKYLVEDLRVDVDAADDFGFTPLIFAMNNENLAVFKYLLDHGADKDKVYRNCEMIELLFAKGAYIDPVADRGTPIHIAAMEGQAGAMKLSLDHNADCNKTDKFGATPLLAAINAGSLKCVKLLVEAGADVKADCIFTALIDAANDGSSECLDYLLRIGANRNVPDDISSEDPNGHLT
nr:unnamed protein product [Digitaria exilis]